jgi:hypothetical protein
MATQPQPDLEPETDPAPADNDDAPRDFEGEARSRGWVPQEDFRGDTSRWVDAQTFIERTDTVMPLLKADRDRLKRELADMKRDMKRIGKYVSESEGRLRAEIQSEMEDAVKDGDVEGFRAAQKRAEKIDDAAPKHSQEDAIEAFDAFRDRNQWYDKANLANASEMEVNARLYADRMAEKHVAKTADMAPDDFFNMIEDKVRERFPTIGQKPTREKPGSDVGAPTNGRGNRNTKSWESLPDEARRRFDKWIGQGMGTKDYYLKTFDWAGFEKAAS